MMTDAQRAAVVGAAQTWVGTAFHHGARVKGAGVDCMQLIAAVFEEAGVVPSLPIAADYPPDWWMHHSEERILSRVRTLFDPIVMALPGDLVLFRMGRAVSHGALVTSWPYVIHAVAGQSVIRQNITTAPRFERAIAGFWTVKV